MNANDLREQIDIERELIETTLAELAAISRDASGGPPPSREVAAAALFLANVYNGIENILKRVARYHRVTLPAGEHWHIELLQVFSDPPREGLPLLLDRELASEISWYRRFRHRVHWGYGLQLKWEEMRSGVERAGEVFARFMHRVQCHLASLPSN